jgi:CBS domain-containing protein
MIKEPLTVSSEMKVAELADRIARSESQFHRHQAALVLDKADRLVGIITRGDVIELLKENPAVMSRSGTSAVRTWW